MMAYDFNLMFQIIVDQLGLWSVLKEWTEDGRSCVGHVCTDTDNIGYSVYDIDMADHTGDTGEVWPARFYWFYDGPNDLFTV